MYIRTKDGLIGKIVEEHDEYYIVNYRNLYNILVKKNICSEPAGSIIDLVEIGDILSFKEDVDNFGTKFTLGIYELEIFNKIKYKLLDGSLQLISILTRQQFEKETYKIDFHNSI